MFDKKVSNDFILNQMTIIEEDVRYYIEQIESNERFALISTASIWVFVASQHWNNALSIVIWIPTIIVLSLAIKRILLAKTIHAKTEYLKDVESKLELDEGLGWNTFWSKHKYGKWAGNKSYLKWWGRFFWSSLFIGNFLIACFVPFQDILK
jgi:hypothetical protein